MALLYFDVINEKDRHAVGVTVFRKQGSVALLPFGRWDVGTAAVGDFGGHAD